MTGDQLRAVLATYQYQLECDGFKPERCDAKTAYIARDVSLRHVAWMAVEAQTFIEERRIEKAMRWLGFIQGVLWSQNVYTIEEMKEHNR